MKAKTNEGRKNFDLKQHILKPSANQIKAHISTFALTTESFNHVLNDEKYVGFSVMIGLTIFIHTIDCDQLHSVGGIIVY
jgi:hypothetical protein